MTTRLFASVGRALAAASVLILLGTAAAAQDSSNRDWPGFRGPDTSGSLTADGALGDEPGLAVAWKQALGSGYSSVSVQGDRAVTLFSDNTHDWVAAFDVSDGRELWRQKLGDTYKGHDGSHTGPVATPLLANDRVYLLDAHGKLAAYSLADGSAVWSTDLVADHEGVAPFYGFSSSPVLAGGTLVTLVQRGEEDSTFLAGFDPNTGERRWAAGQGTVAYQSPMVVTLNGREQVVAASNENLAGIDPATGEILWQAAHGGDLSAMASASLNPVPTEDGKLLLAHKNDSSALVEVVVPEDGEPSLREVWTTKAFRGSYNVPVYADGVFYGYTGRIFDAVDAATGEVLWRSRQPGDGFVSAVDGHLVVVTKKGELALIEGDREAYKEIARVELFTENSWSPPAIARGKVFVRSMDEIAALDLRGAADANPATEVPVAAMATPPKAVAELLAALEADADHAAKHRRIEAFFDEHGSVVTEGSKVALLYHGEAEDVALESDLTGDRYQEALRRAPGTDLYYWAGEADRNARFSYRFVVNYDQPTVDPHNDWTSAWMMGGEMSSFAMPEWSTPGHLAELAVGAPRGRIETLEIPLPQPEGEAPAAPESDGDGGDEGGDDGEDEAGEASDDADEPDDGDGDGDEDEQAAPVAPTSRTVDVYLPPGYDDGDRRYPVVYVHDGATAREQAEMVRSLDNLVGRSVEPVIAVFVHVLGQMEMFRSDDYIQHVGTAVVPAVDQRFRTVTTAEGRGSVGYGFAGALAFSTAYAFPDLFGNVGAQTLFMLDSGAEALQEKTPTPADRPLDIYLGWNRYDLRSPVESWDMAKSTEKYAEFLRSKGYRVETWVAPEGTGPLGWRSATGHLLEALFPLSGAEDDLAR